MMTAMRRLVALIATTIIALAGTTTVAAADHGPNTSGLLNGNQINTQIHIPITVNGNALNVLGFAHQR